MARQPWRRVVAVAAGAMALVVGVFGAGPTRADAADAAPQVKVYFTEHQVAMGTEPPGAVLVYRLKVTGGPAHHLHLTVDLSGVADFAKPASSEHCTGNLCSVDVPVTSTDFWTLTVLPKPGAAAGATGTVTVSGTASDAAVTGDRLTLTNGKPQLKVSASAETLNQKPGDTLTFPLKLWNIGILPAAKGVELRVDTTAGLNLQGSWANCRDVPVSKLRRKEMTRETLCDFPTPVESGKQYALSSPLRVAVGSNALRDMITYAVTPLTDAPAAPGAGPALTLVPDGSSPADGNIDSYFTTYVDTDNHADFTVTGDTVTGERGGHATLRATVTNLGPALVEDLDDSEAALWVSVKLPTGTKATKVPQGCNPPPDGTTASGPIPGLSAYQCWLSDRPAPGQSFSLTFTVAVGPHTPAVAKGRISTLPIYKDLDPVASNNSAALTVQLTSNGSGGTTSGSGGSGTLAATGFGSWIAWLAGALLLAGGALLATTRRTRAARRTS